MRVEWGLGDSGPGRGRCRVPVPGGEAATGDRASWLAALVAVLCRYGGPAVVAVPGPGGEPVGLVADADPGEPLGVVRERFARLAAPAADAADAVAGWRPVPGSAAPWPLTFAVDGTGLHCAYRTGVVAPEIAAQVARHVVVVRRQVVASPRLGVGEVELLDARERGRVVALGRSPRSARFPGTRIETEFARQVARRPDAVAVCHGRHRLTYRRLDERAERIAGGLRAAGVRPGDLVGVCLPRSTDLVATLLAVLKAGAAYLPLDPDHPPRRRAGLLADAGAALLVGVPETPPAAEPAARTVTPDELASTAPHPGSTATAGHDPAAPAYVIHTSGSTGEPKGVVVPHSNVVDLVAATRRRYRLGPGDTWTLFHSAAFDFSVWEVWGCLLTGGRLVVVPYWVSRTPEEFRALLDAEAVTVLSQTPSAFAQLVPVAGAAPAPLAVRLVVLGGEPLDPAAVRLWRRTHPADTCEVVNMYGITETTVHVTAATVPEPATGRSVGHALPGWSVHVLDPEGRLLPPGVPGEIHVGGRGVAYGYLGRGGLTASRFRPNPFGPGRLYRSGDRGRLRPDGTLDHLGRLDNQVQLRGFRVELDEIRAVLLADPAVRAAAVVLRDADDPARAAVVAYVVLAHGCGRAVRDAAAARLPAHMVPAAVVELPALPLTRNGKVDLARLPPAAPRADPHAPREHSGRVGDVVEALARVLGVAVGPDDDFFELGGNSVLAVRALAELRERTGDAPSLRDLYRHRTARRLAVTR